jgi:hypothetical protein
MSKTVARRREPIRLTRRSGTWSLELTRLVAVDDHVMRPERYRVAATSENLRQASPTSPPARQQEAEAIMHQADDGTDCAFELGGQGWAPVSHVPYPEHSRALRELTSSVSDMRSQLVLLRGMYDALLTRMVAVEAVLPQKAAPAPVPVAVRAEPIKPGPRRVPSRRDMLAVIQPERKLKLDLTLDAFREPQPSDALPPPTAAVDADAVGEAPGLLLPSSAQVAECLQMLAADVALHAGQHASIGDPSSCYVTHLVDAAAEIRVVILLDQRVGAALGGGLLGAPQAERNEQAARGLATDTLDALNEVCNNLGGLVNRANPRAPVTLRPLEAWNAAQVPWLGNARKTLNFATADGGVLWLVAR